MTLRFLRPLAALLLWPLAICGQMRCDLQNYTRVSGIDVDQKNVVLSLEWQGEGGQRVRAEFTLENGQPLIHQLAVREGTQPWIVLGHDLLPEFEVTTGKRRISSTEYDILKKLHQDTPENIEKYKWNVFWDAPLVVPGSQRLEGPPRQESEIARASVKYDSSTCSVKTDGDWVSVTFNGLGLGLFSGDLRFTVYRGSNLLRQEAIASTKAPSVAYIYKAGLKGFALEENTRLHWRDTSRGWQEEDFGGDPNQQAVNLRARNRLEVLDAGKGTLAVFPPPHKFFFARENEVNLGYVYYRKDNQRSFSIGVMQPEHAEGYDPWGISDQVWKRRSTTARTEMQNYALYNAPPGTEQHMAVFYYPSAKDYTATQQAVLAYTHGDAYKPLPGFKVFTGHFHLDLNEMIRDRGTMDFMPTWVPVFKGLGINIVYLGDFHDDSDINDPGRNACPKRSFITTERRVFRTRTSSLFPPKRRMRSWAATGT